MEQTNNKEQSKGYGTLASTGIILGIITAAIVVIVILKELFL